MDNFSIPSRLQNIPTQTIGSHKKHNEWTYHWNAILQNCIIGKTYIQDTDSHSSITTIEHYVPVEDYTHFNLTLLDSSLPHPLILIPCSGCHLNDYSLVSVDTRIKCSITTRTNKLSMFKTFGLSSNEHKKYKNNHYKKYFISTKPLHLIRHSAYDIYLFHHNIIIPSSPSPKYCSQNLNHNNVLNHTNSIIDSALICDNQIKLSLSSIAVTFSQYTNFEFYSDGSVFNIGTIDSKSGFGWVQTDPSVPITTFNGSTIFFPSSFKSESLAILTILITLPPHATCKIYTDSQNCIDTFNSRLNSSVISPRRRLKQNNFLIWDLIFWLITKYAITVRLFKVKAHSHNKYNDQADNLAKTGSNNTDPILINHKFFHQSSLGLFNYNHIHIIDRNIRKWSDSPINSRIFNMAMNNSSLSSIHYQISHGNINWEYTKLWINYNPLDVPTSKKLRSLQSTKIKRSTFNYPTGNILQRNYPNLYPSGQINCTDCMAHEDTNAHVGLCPAHHNAIKSLLKKFKIKLIALLLANNDSTFTFGIDSRVNNSNLFKLLPNVLESALLPDEKGHIIIPNDQPWILLLHHLIPQDLAVLFNDYFSKKRDRERHLIKYITDFISELTIITWSSRSRSFKKWEKSINITSRDKKSYRKNNCKRRSDEIGSTLTDSAHITKTRSRYTKYYHNVSLPYFKHVINFDASASIRWTTCNFLHSGTWESYRDTLLFSLDNFSPVNIFLDSLRPLLSAIT
ncbi:unnamed protein product [Rhizophagus irregularis]|nr:unnamed protein product [Rhizophagus irregularis]